MTDFQSKQNELSFKEDQTGDVSATNNKKVRQCNAAQQCQCLPVQKQLNERCSQIERLNQKYQQLQSKMEMENTALRKIVNELIQINNQKRNGGKLANKSYCCESLTVIVIVLIIGISFVFMTSANQSEQFIKIVYQNIKSELQANQINKLQANIQQLNQLIQRSNEQSNQQQQTKAEQINTINYKINQIQLFLIKLQKRVVATQKQYIKIKQAHSSKGHHHNGHQNTPTPPKYNQRHY